MKRGQEVQAEADAELARYRVLDAKRQRMLAERNAPESSKPTPAKVVEPSSDPVFGEEAEKEHGAMQAVKFEHDAKDGIGSEFLDSVSVIW